MKMHFTKGGVKKYEEQPTSNKVRDREGGAPDSEAGVSLQPVESQGCSRENVGSFWSHLS